MITGPDIFSGDDDLTAGDPAELIVVNASPVTVTETPVLLDSGSILLNTAVFTTDQNLVRVGVYLQGSMAPNALAQVVRGVVYTTAGGLLAVGDEVVIQPHQEPGWVTLPFAAMAGRPMPGGAYLYGLHAGEVNDEASRYVVEAAEGDPGLLVVPGVPYASGPPQTLPEGVTGPEPMAMFLETIAPSVVPSDVLTDDYLSSLPFNVAQAIFRAAGTTSDKPRQATAGWYGTSFDPTYGSNAIVRSDGPLTDLTGERLLVTRRTPWGPRSVAVYVSNELAFPDDMAGEDIVLTERAWLALGSPTYDDLQVTIEVLQ